MKYLLTLFLCASAFGADEGECSRHTAGLVSRWLVNGWQTGNGAAPTLALNSALSAPSGTIIGTCTWSVVASRYALTLAGGGLNPHNIRISDSPAVSPTGKFAIALWARPTDLGNYRKLFDKSSPFSGDSQVSFRAAWESGKVYFLVGNSSYTYKQVNSTVSVPLNSWTHFVFVYDNDGYLRIYFNAKAAGTSAATQDSVADNSHPLQIGRDAYSGSLFFQGNMADFRFYNRALTAAEVAALYKEGLK